MKVLTMATAILQVRVDTDLKKLVEGKLKHMGLNMSCLYALTSDRQSK